MKLWTTATMELTIHEHSINTIPLTEMMATGKQSNAILVTFKKLKQSLPALSKTSTTCLS
jgi:hypothetical protein